MTVQRTLRVLLIDEGREGADPLAASIRSMGHEVCVADRGDNSLRLPVTSPDVIVLSLDLCGADALGLGRMLREQAGLRAPFIVGLADPEDLRAEGWAGEIGTHLVLTEPINLAVLAGVLRRFREFLTGLEECAPRP